MSSGEPLSSDEIMQMILGREPHTTLDAEELYRALSRAQDDVIQKQVAVIETLQQMIKVQGETIDALRKAQA